MQKDWLYEKYHIENLSQRDIAQLCGVSHHTIRSWIRKFSIRKQLGSWSIGKAPVNKGKTKDTYEPLKRVSQKRMGRGHPNPRKQTYSTAQGRKPSTANGYTSVARYYNKTGSCQRCGASNQVTEVHHIDKDPLNFTDANLIELCRSCHKRIHKGVAVKAVKPSIVVSIKPVGEEPVYDIEMAEPHHNYVANGFVVHNCVQSQRYVSYENGFGYIVPPKIEALGEEAVREYEQQMDTLHQWYTGWQEKLGTGEGGNEDARFVLPGACETRMMVTMNVRELRHFLSLRCCHRAQWEIRALAIGMLKICKEVAPALFSDAGPGCLRGHCPEGEKSCGKPWKRADK